MSRGGTRNKEHQELVDNLLFAFGAVKNIRIWVRSVGYDSRLHIKYGENGECDLDGIIGPWGIRFGIEVKTGDAVLSPDQVKWKNNLKRQGMIHIEARSVEQAINDFNREYLKRLDELKDYLLNSYEGKEPIAIGEGE